MNNTANKGVSAGNINADTIKAGHKYVFYPLMEFITTALPEPATSVKVATRVDVIQVEAALIY